MVHDVLDGITTTDMHECLHVFACLGILFSSFLIIAFCKCESLAAVACERFLELPSLDVDSKMHALFGYPCRERLLYSSTFLSLSGNGLTRLQSLVSMEAGITGGRRLGYV